MMAGNLTLSFSLQFLNIFVHISGSIKAITPIWVSLERYFLAVEVEYRLVTGGYGRNRSQWDLLKSA